MEYTDAEGAWNFSARGAPEAGAEFRVAYDPIVDEMFKRGACRRPYRVARGLRVRRVDRARPPRCAARRPTDRKRTPAQFLALIRVDHSALQRGAVIDGETCEITGLGPIPVATARDLLGDAILKVVITKGVDVANVTHLGRSHTVAQRVALWWQAPDCTREGCTRTQRLELDHRYEWRKTHRTRVDETDPLCDHDHDLKTYDGWALVVGRGKRPMVPPDDPRHPNHRAPPRRE